MAFSVTAVSISVSPLRIDEDDTDMFMTSAPSRLPAISNEDCVRVEASKNRLTWVRPRSEVRFLSIWRLSSTYSSERSSRPVISAAERPSMPSRCRCPRTKDDLDADVSKAMAIGVDGGRGKRERGVRELSPGPSGGEARGSGAIFDRFPADGTAPRSGSCCSSQARVCELFAPMPALFPAERGPGGL